MSEVFRKIRLALRSSYKQIALALLSALVFLLLLFPISDLSDLVSAQVAQQTQNRVTLQFTNMQPTFQPQPGLKLENVYLETPFMPALRIGALAVSPALSALTSKEPHGKVTAKGILGGDISLSASDGQPTDEGVARKRIDLNLEKVDLNQLSLLADLPLKLKGDVTGEADALADLSMAVQPEADLSLSIADFSLPNAPVETTMGPLVLPELKLKSIQLKGRLSNGQFIIEEGRIGSDTDEIQGSIKGTIAMRLVKRGANIIPQFGTYALDVDLKVKREFISRADLIFTMMDGLIPAAHRDKIKSPIPTGSRYALKLSGSPMAPPVMRPL